MKRHFLAIGVATVVSAVALVPATQVSASAGANHTTYVFVLGGPNMPEPGPDVSMAPNGSTVTMLGQGSFNAGPNKSISGGGTYIIKDASGTTVASGTWTATQVLGFVNYGPGIPQGAPSYFYGGQATMRVTLSGLGSGVLNINCTLGTPPPGHSDAAMEEGIDLMLGKGLTFNREVSGQTLFINPAQIP